MTLASGWYLTCFYYSADFTTGLNPNGTTMDWNGTALSSVTGTQVGQSILGITSPSLYGGE